MPTTRQKLGHRGEEIAMQYLKKQGYQILKQHYTTRWGEIDLICQNHQRLVFIEVKSRSSRKFGHPEESITKKKLANLVQAIWCYLEETSSWDKNYQFDIISVLFVSNGLSPKIHHWKNIPSLENFDPI